MRPNTILRIAILAVYLLLLTSLLVMESEDGMAGVLAAGAVSGVLFLGSGFVYELLARKGGTKAYKGAIGFAIAALLLLGWVSGAVGIIGSEDNPVNLLYFGVPAVLFLGSIIARLQPRGMVRALFATAIVQALVPVIAIIIGRPQVSSAEDAWGMVGVLCINAFFVLLFVESALLFRSAAHKNNKGA